MSHIAVSIFSFLTNQLISIALVDSFNFFKVCVKAPDNMYPKVCPKIREALLNGMEAAAKSLRYNDSTPVTGFFLQVQLTSSCCHSCH